MCLQIFTENCITFSSSLDVRNRLIVEWDRWLPGNVSWDQDLEPEEAFHTRFGPILFDKHPYHQFWI